MLARSFVQLTSQVGIDCGSLRRVVPQIGLDEAQVDATFQQVSGIAVPQRMNMGLFTDPGLVNRAVQRGLQTPAIERPAAVRDTVCCA